MVSKLKVPHAFLGDISPYPRQGNNIGPLTIPHPKRVKSASLLMLRIIILSYHKYLILMLPWADYKYLSATPADISVCLWLAQGANFGYRYPTIEISGGISSESGSPPIAISPRMALENTEQSSPRKTAMTYSFRTRCDEGR
jgi:hypothetical protein